MFMKHMTNLKMSIMILWRNWLKLLMKRYCLCGSGHPRVAETTTVKLLALAKDNTDIDVKVLGGKSFIDDVFEAVNVDPNDGFTLLDATSLQEVTLNVRTHTLITQVYSAMVAANLKITLWNDILMITLFKLSLVHEAMVRITL